MPARDKFDRMSERVFHETRAGSLSRVLAEWAIYALQVLEEWEEWGPDTLEEISFGADQAGLIEDTADFVVVDWVIDGPQHRTEQDEGETM